jgi:hypothetical protein
VPSSTGPGVPSTFQSCVRSKGACATANQRSSGLSVKEYGLSGKETTRTVVPSAFQIRNLQSQPAEASQSPWRLHTSPRA